MNSSSSFNLEIEEKNLTRLQIDKSHLQTKHDDLTIKMEKVQAFMKDCQMKLEEMEIEQSKIKGSMNSLNETIKTSELEIMSQKFSKNTDLLVQHYYKQNFHHPFVDKLYLPSFIKKTYFQLTRSQLSRVIEFCLERKMVLTIDDRTDIFKTSFVLCGIQLQQYKYIIHKLKQIEPGIQIFGDLQNNGLFNDGSYIEVFLVRRVPYTNTSSQMTNYYRYKMRSVIANMIFKNRIPIPLLQLIYQNYIGKMHRRRNIVLTIRPKPRKK